MIMKKRSLLLGLSLLTAISPVTLIARPGHEMKSIPKGFSPESKMQFLEVMVNNFPLAGSERAVKSVRKSRLS
jgi:hypothetical protein